MSTKEGVDIAARLFREHGTTIRGIVRRYIRFESEVDDVCQDIFLAIVRSPPSHETSLLAYFHTVVRNQVRDSGRRSMSRQRVIRGYTESARNSTTGDNPEARLDQTEQTEKAKKLIESVLPPYMGKVITERYVRQRNMVEIASILKLRKRSVSRYCSVGLRRLRRLMDGDGENT